MPLCPEALLGSPRRPHSPPSPGPRKVAEDRLLWDSLKWAPSLYVWGDRQGRPQGLSAAVPEADQRPSPHPLPGKGDPGARASHPAGIEGRAVLITAAPGA